MIDVRSITDYLRRKSLIGRHAAPEGNLTRRSGPQGNRTIRFLDPGGVGCFVKQPREAGPTEERLLALEQKFYSFCHEELGAAAIVQYLPRLLAHDHPHLLVLELVSEATSLWDQFANGEARDFPVQLVQAVGSTLASFHKTFRNPDLLERLDWLPDNLPSGMLIHRPRPELRATLSSANAQLVRILQIEERLSPLLDQAGQQWQPDTVIHRDFKLTNILVCPCDPGGAGMPFGVRIIDWEHVQFGDPAWDVAGALQDFVNFWIRWMPLSEPMDVDELASRARYPLPIVQKALQAFWHGYKNGMGLSAAEAKRLLLRSVIFSAARLIQTAYEWGASLVRLPRQSMLLLQVSANLLNNPESWQLHLYGIPPE
jgi:Phosphotransferase enzyme family